MSSARMGALQPMRQGARCRMAAPSLPGVRRQRGAIAVIVALLLSVMLGFCALSIDIALGLLVRSELQNAADAAALAGAAKLYDPAVPAAAPDWSGATSTSTSAIALNKSSGITLEDATVVPGYWSVTGSSSELHPCPWYRWQVTHRRCW